MPHLSTLMYCWLNMRADERSQTIFSRRLRPIRFLKPAWARLLPRSRPLFECMIITLQLKTRLCFRPGKKSWVQRKWMRLALSLRRLKSSSLATTDSKLRQNEWLRSKKVLAWQTSECLQPRRPRHINDMTNMKKFSLAFTCLFLCLVPSQALAQQKTKRDKVISVAAVEGRTLGFQMGDYQHVDILRTNGRRKSFFIFKGGLDYFLAIHKDDVVTYTYQ